MAISFAHIKKLHSLKKEKETKDTHKPEEHKQFSFLPSQVTVHPAQVELEKYQIHSPLKNVYYVPSFISQGLDALLMDFFYNHDITKWNEVKSGRRIKVYGGIVTHQGLKNKEPLPPLLQCLCERLHQAGTIAKLPNHILLNQYYPGDGILPHTDGPAYFPEVCILSLNSSLILSFWNNQIGAKQVHSITGRTLQNTELSLMLEKWSLLVFSEDAYSHKLHGILQNTSDPVSSEIVGNYSVLSKQLQQKEENLRKLRVSLTIRYVYES